MAGTITRGRVRVEHCSGLLPRSRTAPTRARPATGRWIPAPASTRTPSGSTAPRWRKARRSPDSPASTTRRSTSTSTMSYSNGRTQNSADSGFAHWADHWPRQAGRGKARAMARCHKACRRLPTSSQARCDDTQMHLPASQHPGSGLAVSSRAGSSMTGTGSMPIFAAIRVSSSSWAAR